MITRERVREAFLDAAPRPKLAAGLIASMVLFALQQLGVDVGVLGLSQEAAQALIVFAVMYLWRDRFSIPMGEALEAQRTHREIGLDAEEAGEMLPDPPDLSPVPSRQSSRPGD
jgi:hypothetical protein